jgi:nicotinate-nucleotide adenylyltransferase
LGPPRGGRDCNDDRLRVFLRVVVHPPLMASIGLFGGSFNPPHIAHQLVALYVLESQDVDQVWLVPTFRHAFGKDLAPFSDRVAMCEQAMASLGSRVAVSQIEATLAARPGFVASRTLHLVEALLEEYPDYRFRLVIGSDILSETSQWYRWDDVVRLAPPIVIGRSGHLVPGCTATELAMPLVSSTEIRRRLSNREPVGDLLPRQVVRYIDQRGLYR